MSSPIVEHDLTSGAERIIATGALGNFNLSPDGRSIAAVKKGLGNVTARGQSAVEIRIDTGTTRELLRTGPSEVFPPYAVLPWTPD